MNPARPGREQRSTVPLLCRRATRPEPFSLGGGFGGGSTAGARPSFYWVLDVGCWMLVSNTQHLRPST